MPTITDMLKRATIPLGKTMYIYGGGWNEADTGAGAECLSLSLPALWVRFANTRTSSYDHKLYDYRQDKSVIHLGLDCSAYVGWVLHGTLGGGAYVFKSTEAVKRLSELGFGIRHKRGELVKRRAGDIMSAACEGCAHVYICVGECEDGSVVLLHSSPPGVQISGTCTPNGNFNSEAIALAKRYMCKFYPKWMQRFPNIERGESYLNCYEQLENTSLADCDGLREQPAGEVLRFVLEG